MTTTASAPTNGVLNSVHAQLVHDKRTIVVVGGVAGGATAATRARRTNESAHIIIFERGPFLSFSNCGLPYFVGGVVGGREKMFLATPASLKARYDIDAKPLHEVVGINRKEKKVTVKDLVKGETFTQLYDKLILCPGASAIVPTIPGSTASNIFTLKTVPDADAILAWIAHLPNLTAPAKSTAPAQQQPTSSQQSAPPPRAVLIGAGFIGLETTESLKNLGMHCTLIELVPQLLPSFDADMARMVSDHFIGKGVDVVVGDGVVGLETFEEKFVDAEGKEKRREVCKAVVLGSGKKIACDIVIMSIGVRPELSLARSSDLSISPTTNGIVIDEFCRSVSDPNIYVCGDAAETTNIVSGTKQRFALAGPANRMGRVAGTNAASSDVLKFPGAYGTCIAESLGIAAAQTGLSEKACKSLKIEYGVSLIHQLNHTGVYPGASMIHIKLVYELSTHRILGAQIVGPVGTGVDKRCDVVATALLGRLTIEEFENVDLAYSPQVGSAKDPIHTAAFVAENQATEFVGGITIQEIIDRVSRSTNPRAEFQLVDSRDKNEWTRDGVPDVKGLEWMHVPVNTLRTLLVTPQSEASSQAPKLDPTKQTFVLCHSGLRSYIASRMLMGRGFGKVWNIEGGMMMVPKELRRKEA